MSRSTKGTVGIAAAALFAALALAPGHADAQIKPRILILFDTSGSMTQTISPVSQTLGDGTSDTWGSRKCCPGLGNSRLYSAKKAMRSMLNEAGDIDFSLMKFPQTYTSAVVTTAAWRADWYFANQAVGQRDFLRYKGIAGTGTAPPYNYTAAGAFTTQPNYLCEGFVSGNTPEIIAWMDNTEYLDATQAKTSTFQGPGGDYREQELRADGGTPLGEALQAAYTYLQGVMGSDSARDCRPYSVVILADGDYDGTVNPAPEVTDLYNIGATEFSDPDIHIKTWVIGLAVASANLDLMATNGGTGYTEAFNPTSEEDLTNVLYTIISESIIPEECDGIDNDCDGDTDEGFELYCDGWDGSPTTLEAAEVECEDPGESECDGIDDNCDGEIDNEPLAGWAAVDGDIGDPCGTSTGDCIPGTYQCVPGSPTGIVCIGGYGGTAEICDDFDNDCDGSTDEDVVWDTSWGPNECGMSDTLPCAFGHHECSDGAWICVDNVDPGTELSTCNDLDDDCDSETDEGISQTCGGAVLVICEDTSCPDGLNEGVCQVGTQVCAPGVTPGWGACVGSVNPSTEICDGLDNDCAGKRVSTVFTVL